MARKSQKLHEATLRDRYPIRWMIRRDMPEILEIEAATDGSYWLEEEFLTFLRQRNAIGMVAELDDRRIVGFMVYELFKAHLNLVKLAVHPNWRREQIGTAMINRLKEKLSQQRRTEIRWIVRESDTAGQLFLKACGFEAMGVVREHFVDTDEDGYEMRLRMPEERGIEHQGPTLAYCPHCGHKLKSTDER